MSGKRNLDGLKTLASKCIEKAYDKGYKSGLNDGNINDGTFAAKVKEAYNNGLSDAEKAIKRVINEPSKGGLYANEMQKIFETKGTFTILLNYSMPEIIEKIREYDGRKQQEELVKFCNGIHIGDEVYILDKNHRSIVTALLDGGNKANLLCVSGNYIVIETQKLHKTGRLYCIVDLLKGLSEEHDDD
jgi:hypothetical protein